MPVSIIAQSGPSDSLLLTTMLVQARADDWKKWKDEVQAGVRSLEGVPELIALGALPFDERPNWACVHDSVYWKWLVSAGTALHARELDSKRFTPRAQKVESELHRSMWSLEKKSWWWSAIAWLVLLLAGWFFRFQLRKYTAINSSEWSLITEGLKSGGRHARAIEEWQVFRSRGMRVDGEHPLWRALSASEKELALYLSDLQKVRVIAKKMACSESYVYNLRSSIRKKWDLKPEDDLVHSIRQILESTK